MTQLIEHRERVPWTRDELETVLYAQKSRYHDLHPFIKE